jgi:hypothetical protein
MASAEALQSERDRLKTRYEQIQLAWDESVAGFEYQEDTTLSHFSMSYVVFIEEWRFSTRPLVRPDCFCWISARTVPCMPGAFPEEADDAVFPL